MKPAVFALPVGERVFVGCAPFHPGSPEGVSRSSRGGLYTAWHPAHRNGNRMLLGLMQEAVIHQDRAVFKVSVCVFVYTCVISQGGLLPFIPSGASPTSPKSLLMWKRPGQSGLYLLSRTL